MVDKDPVIYVGYDPREQEAYDTLVYSIRKYPKRINVVPLNREGLRAAGMYRRLHTETLNNFNTIQRYDYSDGKPFSTEFSFTRFLVPALQQYSGWALFMDTDMYFRTDPNELLEGYRDESKAIMVVKHNYHPTERPKLDYQLQQNYNKKNWSSVMYFNCGHEANKNLTVDDVSTKSGRWLHQLSWLDDSLIGELPTEWNWLDGWSDTKVTAKNVHFTTGGPWFPHWKGANAHDEMYAAEWKKLNQERKDAEQ